MPSRLDGEALAALRELARQPKVVAVGEIGLDFYRNLSPQDRAAAGVPGAIGLGGQVGQAGDRPRPRGPRRGAKGTDRLGSRPGRIIPCRAGRGVALLFGRPVDGQAGHRPGFLYLDLGAGDLSKRAAPGRDRAGAAARPAADRDRLPVSDAASAPGQAQRAGLRAAGSRGDRQRSRA